jgi:hypothetical protein
MAVQHALRRASHQNVLRWKLLDDQKRQVATGFGGRLSSQRDSDMAVPTVGGNTDLATT